MFSKAKYLAILVFAAGGLSTAALACKFCPPETGPSVLAQFDSTDASVLAELVQRADPLADEPVTRYRIVVVLKGDLHVVQMGDIFEVPLDVQSPVGTTHLFFSDDENGQWQNPLGITRQCRSFLELVCRVTPPDEDDRPDDHLDRLVFLLPYLISSDAQVSESVHGAFSAAPWDAIQELKFNLDHKQLVSWIQSDDVTGRNRRLLFMLLGLCGDRYDLFVVNQALDSRLASGEGDDLDAILSAWLSIRGLEGLDEIESRCLGPEVPLAVKRAVASAFRFLGDQRVDRARIIDSCRLLLNDPRTADYVIEDLARWKDWESLDEVLALWNTRDENRWLKYPILEYLKVCPLPAARRALQSHDIVNVNRIP
ncbi:MAG: hypothetical protein ACR2NP_07240 [Pirellulaceae bacterium]